MYRIGELPVGSELVLDTSSATNLKIKLTIRAIESCYSVIVRSEISSQNITKDERYDISFFDSNSEGHIYWKQAKLTKVGKAPGIFRVTHLKSGKCIGTTENKDNFFIFSSQLGRSFIAEAMSIDESGFTFKANEQIDVGSALTAVILDCTVSGAIVSRLDYSDGNITYTVELDFSPQDYLMKMKELNFA